MIIAHRGMHTVHPENTMAAIEAAIAAGADGIETDLRHTQDNQLVLFHDHMIGNTHVADMTLEELRNRTGIDVPTLGDLDAVRERTFINLEIKTMAAWVLARATLKKWASELLITSFLHGVAYDAKWIGHDAGLLIAHAPVTWTTKMVEEGPSTIIQDYKVADIDTTRLMIEHGWRFGVYGPRGGQEHENAHTNMHSRYIITDEVEATLSMLRTPS